MLNGNLSSRKFTKINEGFTCSHCHKEVRAATATCRNHCPFCLYSKHVDIFPGDRGNDCHGLLEPIGYKLNSRKGLVIEFRCQRCHAVTRNMANMDDEIQADNYDALLALS